MPLTLWVLVGLFTAVSVAAGAVAARLVGPPRPWAVIAPSLAAFGALYLVGHRGVSVGPVVTILGFEISLAFDVAVALSVALVAAVVQRAAWRGRPNRPPGPGGGHRGSVPSGPRAATPPADRLGSRWDDSRSRPGS